MLQEHIIKYQPLYWWWMMNRCREPPKHCKNFLSNHWIFLHGMKSIMRSNCLDIQYIPRNMHTDFALLCFVVVIHWLIFAYPSSLLHWHCGNLTIDPVPAKQPWWIWINTSCEFIMNDCITTTKQSTTKPCAYFLGYTVAVNALFLQSKLETKKQWDNHFSGLVCASGNYAMLTQCNIMHIVGTYIMAITAMGKVTYCICNALIASIQFFSGLKQFQMLSFMSMRLFCRAPNLVVGN